MLKYIPTLGQNSVILDPWNGAGTTTKAASELGIRSFGLDLNPVMVVVAKARQLTELTKLSVEPIWARLQEEFQAREKYVAEDPLGAWFRPSTVGLIRSLERGIAGLLVPESSVKTSAADSVDHMSDLAAFFYNALFLAAKQSLSSRRSSNPTWIKRPRTDEQKIELSSKDLLAAIEWHLITAASNMRGASGGVGSSPHIAVGASESIKLVDNSVDVVLTSPPYCTRIDYAIASAVELAILGVGERTGLSELRNSLMGTTTVGGAPAEAEKEWGSTCCEFLSKLKYHSSYASSSYYYKNHLKYFRSLGRSVGQISRVLKSGGIGVFVVQDSRYKDLKNDLAMVVSEMADVKIGRAHV